MSQPYSNEQARIAENLALVYEALVSTMRQQPEPVQRLAWKRVGNGEYLYQIRDRVGNGTSLGPRSEATEARWAAYVQARASFQAQEEQLRVLKARIAEVAAQYRALRLPLIDEMPGRIFREIDRRGMFAHLQVAGTLCMAAYELEGQARFDRDLGATADCDFTLNYQGAGKLDRPQADPVALIDLLKGIDPTFTENMERPFQARNAAGYEVEFLLGQSEASLHPRSERIRPIPLPEQDWLLRGRQVSQVVLDRSGMPARIVAPDPRWLALHKLWLANKPERRRAKVEKDWKQGLELLGLIKTRMEHFSLGPTFRHELPPELAPYLEAFELGQLDPAHRNALPASDH